MLRRNAFDVMRIFSNCRSVHNTIGYVTYANTIAMRYKYNDPIPRRIKYPITPKKLKKRMPLTTRFHGIVLIRAIIPTSLILDMTKMSECLPPSSVIVLYRRLNRCRSVKKLFYIHTIVNQRFFALPHRMVNNSHIRVHQNHSVSCFTYPTY